VSENEHRKGWVSEWSQLGGCRNEAWVGNHLASEMSANRAMRCACRERRRLSGPKHEGR